MPQTRAETSRQARGVGEPRNEEKLLADGWMRARGKKRTWFKIKNVLFYCRKPAVEDYLGADPEAEAAVDWNYGNLRQVSHGYCGPHVNSPIHRLQLFQSSHEIFFWSSQALPR